MAVLLNGVTEDTSSSAESLTGPSTVYASGVFDGASVEIRIAPSDVSAKYVPAGRVAMLQQPGVVSVDAVGAYHMKAVSSKSGALTELTVEVVQ